MNVLSICGVDGTGKTTLARAIRDIPVVRSPQYHESAPPPPAGTADASRALDRLGDWADARGDVQTKACALFLAMTLGGAAEREAAARARSAGGDLFARERDPIVDSLVYARFYVQLMSATWKVGAIPPEFRAAVEERCAGIGQTPESLGAFIRATFSKPAAELVPALYGIYGVFPSTGIAILRATEATLRERMELKRRDRGGAVEQHEGVETLLKLQDGLVQVAGLLAAAPLPDGRLLRVETIDVDGLSPDDVRRELGRRFGIA